jgi:hypothetical protein
MNEELQSVQDEFLLSLAEVDILLSSAEACTKDEAKYAAYNKSALLLLSGKFENFVEAVAEEYVFIVNNLNLRSSKIPDVMKLHHSYALLNKLENARKNGQDDAKKILEEIGAVWVTNVNFNKLDIECKFNYGKHGEKELKKLFIPIGIDDIFEAVEINFCKENVEDDEKLQKIDFKGVFNSVMNMRNNILHQNASPNLTLDRIREYQGIFKMFAAALVVLLDNYYTQLIPN